MGSISKQQKSQSTAISVGNNVQFTDRKGAGCFNHTWVWIKEADKKDQWGKLNVSGPVFMPYVLT
jgi:hypothetical protein